MRCTRGLGLAAGVGPRWGEEEESWAAFTGRRKRNELVGLFPFMNYFSFSRNFVLNNLK